MKISVEELRLKNAEKEAEKVASITKSNFYKWGKWHLPFMLIYALGWVYFSQSYLEFSYLSKFLIVLFECSATSVCIYTSKRDIKGILNTERQKLIEISEKYRLSETGKTNLMSKRANIKKYILTTIIFILLQVIAICFNIAILLF